jgi:crotonobetainyl-CoA:carnitine CoA-transferase CaiB-like acyl-CoA transferase
MSAAAAHRDARPPWLGEHTSAVLSAELGLAADEIDGLVSEGVIA